MGACAYQLGKLLPCWLNPIFCWKNTCEIGSNLHFCCLNQVQSVQSLYGCCFNQKKTPQMFTEKSIAPSLSLLTGQSAVNVVEACKEPPENNWRWAGFGRLAGATRGVTIYQLTNVISKNHLRIVQGLIYQLKNLCLKTVSVIF